MGYLKNILTLLLGLVLIFVDTAYAIERKKSDLADMFYPGDQVELNLVLDRYLNQAQIAQVDGEIIGAISPHAGYSYSGPVAAHTYKSLINKDFEVIVILAQSHRYFFNGISVYPFGSFDTPLGPLFIDENIAGKLAALPFCSFEKQAFISENALETQLPFIKKTLGNIKIVPLVFGEIKISQLQVLAEKLAEISKNRRIAVIASTDLSHYLSYTDAVKADAKTIKLIINKDFYSLGQCDTCACGINPVITLMLFSKLKEAEIKVLKYANSGDTSGEKKQVVGYLSAIAYCPVIK